MKEIRDLTVKYHDRIVGYPSKPSVNINGYERIE